MCTISVLILWNPRYKCCTFGQRMKKRQNNKIFVSIQVYNKEKLSKSDKCAFQKIDIVSCWQLIDIKFSSILTGFRHKFDDCWTGHYMERKDYYTSAVLFQSAHPQVIWEFSFLTYIKQFMCFYISCTNFDDIYLTKYASMNYI